MTEQNEKIITEGIPFQWLKKGETLEREFTLKNFEEAISFVNRIAYEAEKIDHHPDILIHSYKKVKITLTTHSKGKVTEKDYMLAKLINELPTTK